MTVRPIDALGLDEIRLIARDLADSGEPMQHGFEPGTSKAVSFELAYQERRRELEAQEG